MMGGPSGGGLWRVDDTGWTTLTGGGGTDTYPVQSMSVLPDGDVLVGSKNASGCYVARIEDAVHSTNLNMPSGQPGTCVEAYAVANPNGTPWLVLRESDGNTWRYQATVNPQTQLPDWTEVFFPFLDSDPDDVAFNADGHLFMVSRGATNVSGMLLVDWSAENGKVIGNWPDSAEMRFRFYGSGVPAVIRLVDVTGTSVTRKFDIVVSLQNRM